MFGRKLPRFSIVVPIREGESTPAVVRALEFVDDPKDKVEILVSAGNNPSAQRNEAANKASGEIIFFLDDDAIPDVDLLRFASRTFADQIVAIAGGPSEIIANEKLLQRSIGYVLGSFFATANIRCRYRAIGRREQEGSEQNLILCNLAVRKSIFDGSSGFDERLYPNEENEFINRMLNAGHRAVYNPKLVIARPHRSSIARFVQQMLSYGKGRMQHIVIRPSFANTMYLLPVAFVAYLVSLPFVMSIAGLSTQLLLYLLPMMAYVLGITVSSLRIIAEERDLNSVLIVPLLFPIVHLSYALGLVWGLIKRPDRRPRYDGSGASEQNRPRVWLLKPFGTAFFPEDSPQSEAIGNEAFLVRELA